MANRYWVGGSGTWNTTSTTNWSASTGGPSGASVPTAADSVFFDQAGTYTVTCTGALTCLDITVSAGTVTFANGTSPTFAISGSMSLVAGTVWSSTGAITFNATTTGKTVTTNGVSVSALTFNGIGGAWTLGSALTSASTITVTAGTFSTNNFNVTATQLAASNTNIRTINLGSSTVALTGTGTQLNLTTTQNLTLNAGTSTITSSGTATPTFAVGGATLNNVSFTNTGVGTIVITGAATFSNLTVTAPASVGATQVTFSSRITINGALSTPGSAGNRRVLFRSNTYGIAQTFSINSTPSLTDADFRDIYVIGTAAPISGTRIGNLGGCSGITFTTPKTVYWANAAGGSWSGNNWAATAGGAVNTDNFPLAQDTATFVNTGLVTSATVTLDTATGSLALPTVDMSGRTNAMTLAASIVNATIYGNWTNGSGTTLSGAVTFTFAGRNTQTITSAGKTFTQPFTIDTYGGSVELADALNIGTNTLLIANGTFDTKNYNVTAGALSSNNSNVRTITLGSSTVTLSGTATPINFTTSTNLTFNCGTSSISSSYTAGATFQMGGQTFYDITQGGASASPTNSFSGSFTCRNLTLTGPSSANIISYTFSANVTITGTLTCAGATAVRRVFVRSDTLGTQRDLTVGTLSANDCDFRDIEILGAAIGTAPTRAGDCGGNNNITFPSPKTVYWNLAGAQNWSATGWATSSGGTPALNNFPLAQDTAVFDNTGSVTGNISFDAAWSVGTFDASGRTSAMTLTTAGNSPSVYGDWKFGTGVSSVSTTGAITFQKRGTQTITSNGVTFGCALTIDSVTGTVQLADALTLNSARTLTVTSGTFDAVSYNVTVGLFSASGTTARSVYLRSGTWTLSGTGTVWDLTTVTNLLFFKGTAGIVLSDTSTTARTFNGGAYDYTSLTIGGTTGVSTTTITGNNCFYTLASTKTVAHTIALGATTQIIGVWTISGTAGNVVTISGTANIYMVNDAVSGVDYLALGTTVLNAGTYAEFYAGANSTGGTNFSLTTKPAARTLYWVGGTGNWSSTANWSLSSGGAGGQAIPRSFDTVIFNSASNAVAYTCTIDVTARSSIFNIAGPASGNVTLAGTQPNLLVFHQSAIFAATGVSRSFSGTVVLAGSGTGKTFTSNGVSFIGLGVDTMTINSPNTSWAFVGATNLSNNSALGVFRGSLDTAGYTVTTASVRSFGYGTRSISFGASTLTVDGSNNAWNFGSNAAEADSFTFNAGTSQINMALSSTAFGFPGNGKTFYNVSFTGAIINASMSGANTFNNLTLNGKTASGYNSFTLAANITVNGTFTCDAGASAINRNVVASNTVGTTRTITCNAVALTDVDFRDITIAGAAAPASGTRLGDRKGNSGITFTSKTVYWNLAGGGNWSSTAWALTGGGATAAANFPLPQDTAIIQSTGLNSGATITVDDSWQIGTIDMSARTSNTMTLETGTTTPTIYGNWINGTGTTLSGTGRMTFSGRNSQTITSAGKTFSQSITINTIGGSVTLQDAISFGSTVSGANTITAGTFDANGYNVTTSATFNSDCGITTSGALAKTLAIGSGTWSIGCVGNAWNNAGTNVTITGTGTISTTNAVSKTFVGGGISYAGVTLNQGGAGALAITGNNTFKDITNSYSATGATNINFGTTTTTLTQFTGTGTSGKVLTIQGTAVGTPGTLILTTGKVTTSDYLAVLGLRAYSLTDTWYAGANSTNLGSLGWIFAAGGGTVYIGTILETSTVADLISASLFYGGVVSETVSATDALATQADFAPSISETATGTDALSVVLGISSDVAELVTGTDTILSGLAITSNFADLATATDTLLPNFVFANFISEASTATDAVSVRLNFDQSISETATSTDTLTATMVFTPAVYVVAIATDALTAQGTYNVVAPEAVSATDASTTTMVLPVSLADFASAADALRRSAVRAVELGSYSETGATATSDQLSAVYTPPTLQAVLTLSGVNMAITENLIYATYIPPTTDATVDENIIYATVLNGPAQAN